MAKIFAILVSMGSGFFAQFLLFFGRKYSVATATILAYIATTIAMIFCLKTIIASIFAALFIPTELIYAFGLFIPDNIVSVISLVTSGRLCRAAYDMAVIKIDLVAKSN